MWGSYCQLTGDKKSTLAFGLNAGVLSADEVVEQTGHVIGVVCPFGVANDLDVYLDVSMKRFETVLPACGNTYSAIELTLDELMKFSSAKGWVNVCKGWGDEQEKVTTAHTQEKS